MTHHVTATKLNAVDDDDRGERIRARRTDYGMKVSDLARLAGVDRGKLGRFEKGEEAASLEWVARVERALSSFEEEAGIDVALPAPREPQLIEFEVTGDFGVRVVVKGPIENAAELEQSVARLIRDMKSDPSPRKGESA